MDKKEKQRRARIISVLGIIITILAFVLVFVPKYIDASNRYGDITGLFAAMVEYVCKLYESRILANLDFAYFITLYAYGDDSAARIFTVDS